MEIIILYTVVVILVLALILLWIAFKGQIEESDKMFREANNEIFDQINEIGKLEQKLHNMECNRNYYRRGRNKLEELLLSYKGKEKTLDKLDKLTSNNKKGKN